jgi:hypothetical protein
LEQIKSSTVLNFKFQFLLSGQAPTSQPTQSHSHCHQVPCISPRAAGPLVNPGPSYQPRPSLPCAARDASRRCSPALPSTPRGAAPQAPPHVAPSTIAPPPQADEVHFFTSTIVAAMQSLCRPSSLQQLRPGRPTAQMRVCHPHEALHQHLTVGDSPCVVYFNFSPFPHSPPRTWVVVDSAIAGEHLVLSRCPPSAMRSHEIF